MSGEIFIARIIHGGLAERSGERDGVSDMSDKLLTGHQSPCVCGCLCVFMCVFVSVCACLCVCGGLLHAGDRVVEVNGFPVDGMEPEQVIQIVVRRNGQDLSQEVLLSSLPAC